MGPAVRLSSRPVASAADASDIQLASTVAGVTCRVLLHPIDSVKTRLQHLRGRPGRISARKDVVQFVRREGIGALYRGIVGALAGVVPYSLLYMPSYELAQQQLGRRLGAKELFGVRHVLAGSVAGLCGSLVKVPVDVVKKRLQAGMYPNVMVAVRSIANESAATAMGAPFRRLARFYTGWRSSVIYDIPYNAVQFTVLENVKRVFREIRGREKLAEMDNVVVGALTGVLTSVITEPLDVIKTRMMTQRLHATQKGVTLYKGWLHCMRTMVREEGVAALWKGTLPRLMWVSASSAIWYATYEATRQRLAARRLRARRPWVRGRGDEG